MDTNIEIYNTRQLSIINVLFKHRQLIQSKSVLIYRVKNL